MSESKMKKKEPKIMKRKKPTSRTMRLCKIRDAQTDLESALLTLKEKFKIGWTGHCFDDLYYLVRLARKAP